MESYLTLIKKRNEYCIDRIKDIEGLSVQSPKGAFYMFIKLTDPHWFQNDKEFVLKLLHEQHVLTVHGSGFSNIYGKGHFRIVFLPTEEILKDALDRIEIFLSKTRN